MHFCAADEYMQKRVEQMQKALRAAGAGKGAALPAAFIENSSHCQLNADGEKVIGPNKDRRWLPDLMTQVCTSNAFDIWCTSIFRHEHTYKCPAFVATQ